MNALFLLPHPQNLAERLGFTLLHSGWQIALLGALAWVVLRVLRRHSANLRYSVAALFLLAMLIAPILTFGWMRPTPAVPSSILMAAVQVPSIEGSAIIKSFWSHAREFAPWLTTLWGLGALGMLFRMGGGLWHLERVYLAQTLPANEPWQDRVIDLAYRMGIQKSIRLLECPAAVSPLVVGWLRPAILLPASLCLNLSPQALEAVLAHELAHIRRHDYLANLLQSVIESLLFYHPAVWWLSAQVRELREHCCDDIAAEALGDPMILAESLCALERLRLALPSNLEHDPEPALAAAKGKLMNRITRLFETNKPQAPTFRGLRMALIATLVLGAGGITAQRLVARQTEETSAASLKIAYQPPPPAYPKSARQNQVQGLVLLDLDINEKGLPETVTVLQGPEALRSAAANYAKGWRFQVQPGIKSATFRLNLLYQLKNIAQDTPEIPSCKGPSATIEILSQSLDPNAQESELRLTDFSQIVITHQPPPPAYPEEAKAQKIQGTVVVEIIVDEAGRPDHVQAIEGPEALKATAVAFAEAFRFEPAQLDGKAVKARFRLTMPFRLRLD